MESLGAPCGRLFDWRLVQHYLDARSVGLYSPVLMVAGTMELLPLAFSQVIYPRMSQYYGRTHNVGGIIRMAIRPCLMLTAGMAPLAVVGWWLARPLASSLLLGRYDDAIPAMQWGLLPSLAVSLCPVFNVYNVVRRQDLYGIVQVLGIGTYFITLMWLVRGGPYLAAFPQAMLAGRVIYVIAGYLFLIVVCRQHRKE